MKTNLQATPRFLAKTFDTDYSKLDSADPVTIPVFISEFLKRKLFSFIAYDLIYCFSTLANSLSISSSVDRMFGMICK